MTNELKFLAKTLPVVFLLWLFLMSVGCMTQEEVDRRKKQSESSDVQVPSDFHQLADGYNFNRSRVNLALVEVKGICFILAADGGNINAIGVTHVPSKGSLC